MSKIHLIGGEKGGVGKSVVARVVAQYMIDKSIPFLGFDTDRSHGSLLRFTQIILQRSPWIVMKAWIPLSRLLRRIPISECWSISPRKRMISW